MNVAQILCDRAASSGDQPAIIDYPRGQVRTTSFRELADAAAQAAGQLQAAGLRPGDAVLVLVPMSAELYIALSALFRLGLVAMFLDPSAGRKHIDSCCALNPPQAFIGSPAAQALRCLSPGLRRIPRKFTTRGFIPGARRLIAPGFTGAVPPLAPCTATTPALIRFTSGSTAEPKAAVRTHGFLREQQRVIERSLGLQPGEVDFSTLPIFVLANLASGVTSILPNADLRAPARVNPVPVLQQFQRHRPDRVSASPALLARLAEHCAATGETLGSLKRVFTGGAPVFPRLLDQLQAMAPAAEIVAVYGSTEAEPIAKISLNEITAQDRQGMLSGRGLLSGFPDPDIQLRILREGARGMDGAVSANAFGAASLSPGEFGEIVVNGPHVQPGYLNGIGDAETKLSVDGRTWHKTGDAGYLDERGRVWLLGRSRERIQDAAGVIYPFQVECAAQQDPAVRRSALIAWQGQRWLVVEAVQGLTPQDLTARLAWARLDQIRFVRRIPVDQRHNAKVDYPALRRML